MNRCTPRSSTIRRFALHPLSMALALSSLSTAAWASPFTGLQSTQNVTIHDRGQGATDVLQSAQVGIIRTQGFGIGTHESLRALQPNAQSSLLIDVLGPVRTDILGSLTANGRILISNPYGVYFGAGAQINVGSLVATTLGVNSDDLLTGRIRLKDNGRTIGSVINAGQISATGTVALVGPQVSNEGHITASRVGLAATSEVLVDVEGDGLIFFQMSGEKAGQRLSQLGQITADGGVVDLRANARGTMADTVLNMDGLIQARSVGSRQGQVFIDGGAQGRTSVNGQIDASGQGAGEQ
ncbi:MAG TPA: filamentous hemagglutinin N-terminal domain-containing protein, partial [Aquabacterium sp.]|nr:filamentous hemagglutinin N-terminal domain-containing protein [Aquabacterium sp.]